MTCKKAQTFAVIVCLVEKHHQVSVYLAADNEGIIEIHINSGVGDIRLKAADKGPVKEERCTVGDERNIYAPEIIKGEKRHVDAEISCQAHGAGDARGNFQKAKLPGGVFLDLERSPELRKLVNTLGTNERRNIRRLMEKGLSNQSDAFKYMQESGGMFSTKNADGTSKNRNELLKELTRLDRFHNMKTSTVGGVNSMLQTMVDKFQIAKDILKYKDFLRYY